MPIKFIKKNADNTQAELIRLKKIVADLSAGKSVHKVPCGKQNELKLGFISDLHCGSLFFQPSMLLEYFAYCQKLKVDAIMCAGDILDGNKIYRGQEFEQKEVGLDAQIECFQNIVKRAKLRIPCYFITGNHDSSISSQVGMDIGEKIQTAAKEVSGIWKCLGHDYATITLQTKSNRECKIGLMHPDGGSAYSLCFDDQTEILTEFNGWQLFKDLTPTDRVGTLNPDTHQFEWQTPTAYTDELYKGDMYHYVARSFDLMVTPNHRMYVRRYLPMLNRLCPDQLEYPTKSHKTVDINWQFIEAQNLSNVYRQEWQMTRCTTGWIGTPMDFVEIPIRQAKKYASSPIKHFGKLRIEDASELIGWYATEGSMCKKHKQFTITQSQRVNPLYHAQIIDLLTRIGFTDIQGRGKDLKDITACSVELCDWLSEQCGVGSYNKKIPSWLKACNTDVLRILFDTMIAGDGWDNNRGFGYRSVSKQLLNDVSEIAIKLGYAVTQYGECLSITDTQKYPTINRGPEIVPYLGRIFCVTVPNGIILVRRNGRTIFSGNSYRSQKIIESLPGGTKSHILGIGHFHKAHFMPAYRNVACLQCGTFCSQTSFMKRRALEAHLGGWIVDIALSEPSHFSSSVRAEWVGFYVPSAERR